MIFDSVRRQDRAAIVQHGLNQELQNRLRTAAAHAKVFDPVLLEPLDRPEFRIEWKSAAGEPAPAFSPWLAGGAAEPARLRLQEVVLATPFLDHARLVRLQDGWLVAVLSSDHATRPGEIEVLRLAASELATGRGGPRGMSCPIARDAL